MVESDEAEVSDKTEKPFARPKNKASRRRCGKYKKKRLSRGVYEAQSQPGNYRQVFIITSMWALIDISLSFSNARTKETFADFICSFSNLGRCPCLDDYAHDCSVDLCDGCHQSSISLHGFPYDFEANFLLGRVSKRCSNTSLLPLRSCRSCRYCRCCRYGTPY